MGVGLEQVAKRDRAMMEYHHKTTKHPSGLKRQRLSSKQKQHTFLRDGKLKSCCIHCSKSFDIVERKIINSKIRGAKRRNVCVGCHQVSTIYTT